MIDPTVTAVIATYRAGEYLREAIASALAQTFRELEVLVSDDADDPAVRSLTDSFNDTRVRYLSNPRRLGPAGNHWAAFKAARGRYLAILNHDDRWHPGFVAKLLPPLEREDEIVVAFCDHEVIDSDGRVLKSETDRTTRQWGREQLMPGLHKSIAKLVTAQTIPLAMGAIFRREALDLSRLPNVGPAYDLWLAYELSRGGSAAWYVADRLSAWRVHPQQITGRGDLAWATGSVECWQAMRHDYLYRSHRLAIQDKLARAARVAAKQMLAIGDRTSGRRYARVAIGCCRTDTRAWFLYGLSWLGRGVASRIVGWT